MQSAKKFKDVSALNWFLAGLFFITIYFQTNLADPFNSPKMWALFLFSTYSIGYIVILKDKIFTNQVIKTSLILIIIFACATLLASFATDVKIIAFFGDTYRRNGSLSYLGLILFFIGFMLLIRHYNVKKLYTITLAIALITIFYGGLQTSGNDFINWVNPHNSLIGTQGNPNFAAAAMAIMAVMSVGIIFLKTLSDFQKILGVMIALALLVLIYRSNARQGLIAFAVGLSILVVIILFTKNKKLGTLALILGIVTFVFAIVGMLQIGPLKQLYKPSVTVRGYYWQAAIEMLKANPILGVGMDRYGAYFLEYREVGYPLNYGFEITSSNAHNTFLHFFATGGVLLGGSYVILTLWILIQAIRGLKIRSGDERVNLAVLFSAWVTFQAQSFVSIDNLGLAIWGWALGGAIIGLSCSSTEAANQEREMYRTKNNEIDLKRLTISGLATILALLVVVFLYRAENYTFQAGGKVEGKDQQSIKLYRDAQLKVINSPLVDITYELRSSINLIEFGLTEDGYAALLNVHNKDPRNLDALISLASFHEFKNQPDRAILFREKIALLDPWNAPNYLKLGQDYKKLGNITKSQEMLEKILSFATGVNGGPIAQQAIRDLRV